MAASSNREHSIPKDILDDLCSRFIINVPEEERTQTNRLMFQVELAHWFYVDFYCTDESSALQPCNIKQFALHIFTHLPWLRCHLTEFDQVLARWREYKQAVPTCGAILLDQQCASVLLVQGFYSRASWGFPKGKCNESELNELHRCAIREVQEEIGYDIGPLLVKDQYLEQVVNEQRVRLYLIPGVPSNTVFQPQTRNEIRTIDWFPITDLPTSQKDMPSKIKLGVSPNSFFLVIPFVRPLKRWIHQRMVSGGKRKRREKAISDGTAESGRPRPSQQNNYSQVLQEELADITSRVRPRGKAAGSPYKPQQQQQQQQRSGRIRAKSQSVSSQDELYQPPDGLSAPSWVHFQLDTKAILDAMDGVRN